MSVKAVEGLFRNNNPVNLLRIIEDPFTSPSSEAEDSLAKLMKKIELTNREKSSEKPPPIPPPPRTPARPIHRINLLASRDHFHKTKSDAIIYLSSLTEQQRCPMKEYLQLFRSLQNEFRPSWEIINGTLVKLIVAVTSKEEGAFLQKPSFQETKEMVEEAVVLCETWGEEALLSICEDLNKWENVFPYRITHIFKLLMKDFQYSEEIKKLFREPRRDTICFAALTKKLESLAPLSSPNIIPEEKDITLMLDRFKGADPNVLFPLPTEQMKKIEKQYEKIEDYCRQWSSLRFAQLVEECNSLPLEKGLTELSEETLVKLVAIGRLALRIKYQIYLHNTQILTVLGLLSFQKGSVAQVKTGEGKSMTSALLAFICAKLGESVHLISSSPNLSIRDRASFLSFFQEVGIATSHICDQEPEASRFKAQILYGTPSDFKFAIMKEKIRCSSLFEKKSIPEKPKRFDVAIIDELDTIIDTARNNARISCPTEEDYGWIYYPIFSFLKKQFEHGQPSSFSAKALVSPLKETLQQQNACSEKTMPDDAKLKTWLESAYSALFQKEKKTHYIIDNSKEKTSIQIVDAENTGRINQGSRWSNGVHEFLEIKHDIEPQQESLTPISISHSVLYPMYDFIFGLTGTLGSTAEREELKEIYEIDSFDVPTYHPSKRVDNPPQLFLSETLYLNAIIQKVKNCQNEGRPVLVLCKTIEKSEKIQSILQQEQIVSEMLNEVQQKSEEEILSKAGHLRAVLVATNTAGRGTDIKLEQASRAAGGLHVLLTFFPDSKRVEDQARGRAGRQGDPGSSDIFVLIEHPSEEVDTEKILESLEAKRESHTRVIKEAHICYASVERYLFKIASKFFAKFEEFSKITQQDNFIRQSSSILMAHKFSKSEQLSTLPLEKKDLQIAENALCLFRSKVSDAQPWKAVLTQAGERIKDLAITQWSILFYKEAEGLIEKAGIYESSYLQHHIGQIASFSAEESELPAPAFFQQLETAISKERAEAVTRLKEKIQTLYQEKKGAWRKYLSPSGRGVLRYIRDITGTNFTLPQ